MEFAVKNRDGPARIGEITLKKKKIRTPNIFFVNTSRFKAPDLADAIITNSKTKTEKPAIRIIDNLFNSSKKDESEELQISTMLTITKDLPKELLLTMKQEPKNTNETCRVIPANLQVIDEFMKNTTASIFIVGNVNQMLRQTTQFVEFITTLRKKIGYQKMIYLPCIGDPNSISLFSYMGVDFFDSISAIIAARHDHLFFTAGYYDISEINELPCNCPSCTKHKDKPRDMTFQDILNHNYAVLYNEIKHVRNAIITGRLRELVEMRVRARPELTAVLKTLDLTHYEFTEGTYSHR